MNNSIKDLIGRKVNCIYQLQDWNVDKSLGDLLLDTVIYITLKQFNASAPNINQRRLGYKIEAIVYTKTGKVFYLYYYKWTPSRFKEEFIDLISSYNLPYELL